ncbi:Flagellar motor rotation protein MotA [hydrothermal vent metagenome]|uniref:Flagellar motor rotation protein MotA n=1 Tax=hydrothermal vent metagenome TaxID=652676 RepID=A0A3B0ZEB9_9ZZZZ
MIKKFTVAATIGCLGFVCVWFLFDFQHELFAFLNLPGLLVVLGGTLTATLISRPFADVRQALHSALLFRKHKQLVYYHEIEKLLRAADYYRRGNIRAAEYETNTIDNTFLRSGIQLVLDGSPIKDVDKVMQWHSQGLRSRDGTDAQILRSMASFAPAFGMLGTLLGLIHMLNHLDASSLGQVGAAMGLAMLSTLYGIIAANLVLKPLAIKKERELEKDLMVMAIMREGIILLSERQHPSIIKDTLGAFMEHQPCTATSAQGSLLEAQP